MIQDDKKQQIYTIWDSYVHSNKVVLDSKGKEFQNINESRIQAIEYLKELIKQFSSNEIDIYEFKTTVDSFNKRNNSLMNNFKTLYDLSNKYDILYVEDDEASRYEIGSLFENLFNKVDFAKDGNEGLEQYIDYNDNNNKSYDIIITDIEMPSVNGIELSKNIYKLNKEQKVIVLSAHDESYYLIDLLNLGIAGYIQKPFNKKRILEVLHTICKELDEECKNKTEVKLNNGFIWHCDSKTLTHEGMAINLCASETALLDLLISNRNITFSIDDIFNVVYDDYFEKDLSVDSVKSLLKRIRKKVPSDLIKNIYGEGYRINHQLFTA